jgi:hypothetical protein
MLHLVRARDRSVFLENVEDKMAEQKDAPLEREHSTEQFRSLHKSWLSHRLRWLRDVRKRLSAS